MKINQIKVGVVLSYFSMGVGLLISLIYTPIMIRLLGQSEYGIYSLSESVIAYLGVLNFGFGSAYIRYYSKYKANNDEAQLKKLNGMFLLIFSFIALITLLAGGVLTIYSENVLGNELTQPEQELAKILLIILTINLAIRFPTILFTSYIRVNEKFVFQKFVEIIKIVVNPFLIIPILLLGYGSIGMALITTILSLVTEIIYIIYCFKKLRISFDFKFFDVALFREIITFSFFIFINIVIDQINWNIDKLLLGRFHGSVSVAVYSLAALFNTYYLSVSSAISSVFVPRVHRLVQTNNSIKELNELFVKVGRIQFILLSIILTGFIFFGKPFVIWWAGNDYLSSYWIAVILIAAATIPIIQNIGIEILQAMNLHKFRALTYLIIAILNVGMTIPLVIYYQGIGAAIGTAVAIFLGNGIIMNIYYYKKVKLNTIYFWKEITKIFPGFIVPITFGLIYINSVNIYNVVYFFVGVVAYTLVFFFSMWFFGLNTYEKNLIVQPLKKVLKRKRN